MAEHTHWCFEMLGHWTLAWAAIVALVSTWLLCCQPRRATIRYVGWLFATFAGLALLPAILELTPRSSWRDVLAFLEDRSARAEPTSGVTAFHSWFESRSSRPIAKPLPEPEPSILVAEAPRSVAPFRIPPVGVPQSTLWWNDSILAAFILWVSGVLVFLARLTMAAVQVRSFIAQSSTRDAESLTVEAQAIAASMGMKRRPRVLIHPHITTPICIGLVRPTILWPNNANCPMTSEQRRAALVHEVAHLRHGDDWIALLAELWRALTWFFLPVHYTLSRLRLERECRCDDLAAAEMADPKTYARWLLDLTPVHLGSPLAASLSGASGITARVRRLIVGEPGKSRPLKRRQLIALLLFGILLLSAASSVRLIGTVQAESPLDAPLPEITPKELASRIRLAASSRYDKGLLELSMKTTDNTNWRFWQNQGSADDQTPMLVHFQGRVRFLSDGSRWRVEHDSKMPRSLSRKLTADRWSTGFDGQNRYDWNVMQNEVILGESHRGWEVWRPRNQFWNRGDEFVHDLEQTVLAPSTIEIDQQTIDGFQCYVVNRSYPKFSQRTEEVVSPHQGWLLVRTTYFRKDKPYHMQSLQGVREITPGVWAPSQILEESRIVRDDGLDQLQRRTTMRIERYEPTKVFPPDAFRFKPVFGIDVVDRHIGTSYHNDPWWPEVGKLLRDQFDWPKIDLKPLQEFVSDPKLVNQPAPPITAADWIHTEPIDLTQLKGKVALIDFWSSDNNRSQERIPAMRRLYETYHTAGLEIVSIHIPTQDIEKVRRFVSDYQIPYPVAIDAGTYPTGTTETAYGPDKRNPPAYFVDHQGIVHPVNEVADTKHGPLIATLVRLLEKAGSKQVQPISLETPQLTQEMINAVTKAHKNWIKSSPKGGSIQGRVTDSEGQPVAGATVTAKMQLILLMYPYPGANMLTYPDIDFTAISEQDGQFQLQGLTKGTYELKVTAAGRAAHSRNISIGPDLEPQKIDVPLNQGDNITGTIRDSAGKPIEGATVSPVAWLAGPPEDGDQVTMPSGADKTQTNAQGRFTIGSLRQGRYNLEISAPGHKTLTLEAISSGTQNANATLE